MATDVPPLSRETTTRAVSPTLLLTVFTAAIFLSAALLFAVQPMFAKMVLPRLGGSPAVWSVAMVFFQAALLAGYAYAHALTRYLPGKPSIVFHLFLMAIATFALPLAIASGWGRPPATGQGIWLLGLFVVSIGLPFFALSANGPLLQAWFARTDHPSSRDPYFLYAASNVGSFLALISYPFVVEPLTRLGDQVRGWSFGFYVLVLLIAGCGVLMARSRNRLPEIADSAAETPPSWHDAATWVALAAVPSGLLIAVTAHISTDVAASPFLWVIPLALYLATFVIVFRGRPILPHRWIVMIQPFAVAGLVAVIALEPTSQILLVIAAHVVAFFILALVCHGELARRRPAASHLTAFYMWMSAGGVIGGISTGLIAPHVFSWVAEYPLLVVLATLCLPGIVPQRGRLALLYWIAVAVAFAAILVLHLGWGYEMTTMQFRIVIVSFLVAALLFFSDTLKFAAPVALCFVVVAFYGSESGRGNYVRSFFGVHKTTDTDNGRFRVLKHGNIIHGAQRIRDELGSLIVGRPEPLTYYHTRSPLAQGVAAVRERKAGPLRVAVVGLGSGTMACHKQPGDVFHFYEIDQVVERIARERFTYLPQCAPDASIIIGDARLTLQDATDSYYDVLVVDAFSSDAIPIHLLTREAVAIYMRKMAPGGVVLLHVSNKHLALIPVAAGIARANGLVARFSDTESQQDDDDDNYRFSSTVVAIARAEGDFGALTRSEHWEKAVTESDAWIWTDDYSNIIGAMIRHMRNR